MLRKYVQGYAAEAQHRLVKQAEFWRERLILRDLSFADGESLLEIGCGVGAVLGEIGKAFPNLNLAGIDIEPRQIECARKYLNDLGLDSIELYVGDAARLPLSDASFDRVYAIWLLEHVSNPKIILREALRVLKPGGAITLTGVDYKTIQFLPESADSRYLQDAVYELLEKAGNNLHVARFLGSLLQAAGFSEVKIVSLPMYFECEESRQFLELECSFLELMIPKIKQYLVKDLSRLEAGLEFFRNIASKPEGVVTMIIYRGTGKRL